MATESASVGRESDKFMLRFPEGMRERIASAARANNRSTNSEIIARLAETFVRNASAARVDSNLPPTLLDMVLAKAEEEGSDPSDVVMRALLAGLTGSAYVAYIQVENGMTLDQVRELLATVKPFFPGDAHVMYEMERQLTPRLPLPAPAAPPAAKRAPKKAGK